MKNIVILGSTGTIGQNTLEVVRRDSGNFCILGLACHFRRDILFGQIKEFHPKYVYTEKEDSSFEHDFPDITFLYGDDGLEVIATLKEADIIICAIPGIKALKSVISAIKKKKTICLATKEILVVAGDIIMPLAEREGVKVLPVDSEHNALFQALEGVERKDIAKVYLTASGGPFYGTKMKKDVSPEDALAHPVWKMGKKITVDSATMLNKSFEVIEAHHLFSLPTEKIDVLIHPEAVVHGMVELVDGTIKGILSVPDMKIPISFVLHYPCRSDHCWQHIDFDKIGKLHFYPVERDADWFLLAQQAIEKKGSFPVVFNSANEEAVELFLEGKVKFQEIIPLVKAVIGAHTYKRDISLEDVFYFNNWAKEQTKEFVGVKK
ncbi:MAG: 1-deoxy-D-xylulose-5-phosphate reductoisomerase [Candidatus Ratteibacteria bacterium]|nr:1-deoxy-D-xylulose-5-phosphate reductoisomerase [Candidatus Ratteibacteria bacterium]